MTLYSACGSEHDNEFVPEKKALFELYLGITILIHHFISINILHFINWTSLMQSQILNNRFHINRCLYLTQNNLHKYLDSRGYMHACSHRISNLCCQNTRYFRSRISMCTNTWNRSSSIAGVTTWLQYSCSACTETTKRLLSWSQELENTATAWRSDLLCQQTPCSNSKPICDLRVTKESRLHLARYEIFICKNIRKYWCWVPLWLHFYFWHACNCGFPSVTVFGFRYFAVKFSIIYFMVIIRNVIVSWICSW